MSLATRFKNTANRLLGKFDERESGVDSIQLWRTPVTFNPTTGENEPGTTVITDLVGVSVEFDQEFTNSSDNAIQSGDQLLAITSAIEPFMSDKILLDGLKYSIVSILPSRYTNATILYKIHLRV